MACRIGQIITRGDGRWLIRVYLGRDHETKKGRYHNRTIHSPMREAQAPCSGPSRFNEATVISWRRRAGGCGFSFQNSVISHTYQEKRSNLKLKFLLNSAFCDYEIIGTGAENSQRERQE